MSLECTLGSDSEPARSRDIDVIVVGAGILGIYQLYRAREEGFSVAMFEQGGVSAASGTGTGTRGRGSTPRATATAYLFSDELYHEWHWQEHFAGQPEIERYINHVVDQFDLRQHIRFNTKVTSAI